MDTLDDAWVAAELALGEYWYIRSLTKTPTGWEVVASDGNRIRIELGPTPLAAVRALTHLDAEELDPGSPWNIAGVDR